MFPVCSLFRAIQWKIEALQPEADVSEVMEKVEDLLDESITAKGYIIREPVTPYGKKKLVDLTEIDFKALKKEFSKERKRMEIEKLRGALNCDLGEDGPAEQDPGGLPGEIPTNDRRIQSGCGQP